MKPLPPNFVKLMADADRKALSKDFDTRTPTEAQERWQRTHEKQEQSTFAQWLSLHCVFFVNPRMDKPSTLRRGTPDFVILWRGKGVAVEMKAPGGVLSGDQKQVLSELESIGVPFCVAYSAKEAIEFTRKELGI